ncbi:MAG: TIGR01459 family HAD-type hydrolase [Rhodospirillaceae bacterium]|nr:TIGR01459 family HAD-type hydrolase [Rhodospirillaceae bacterium]
MDHSQTASQTDVDRPPPLLPGLAGLADRYDGFILDLWGVVHDGLQPYPHAVDCMMRLRRAGKQVCLLSNAPRRIASVTARLREIGVPDDAYDHVLSSGEATHLALRDRPDAFHRGLGDRCFHLGPPRDNDVHEGLPLAVVAAPEDASFVLATGINDWDETVEDYEPVLQRCAAAGLPMVCANPDLVVVVGDILAVCAGLMAQRYEELGGRVAYHGKPHAPVYQRCFAMMDLPRPRVLAIGDSLRTDIAGAAAAAIDSIFVTGGIHREELGCDADGNADPDRLRTALAESPHRPTAILPGLRW